MDKFIEAAKVSFYELKRYPLNFVFSIISSLFSFFPFILLTKMFSMNAGNYLIWLISGMSIWMVLNQLIWSVGLSIRAEIHSGTLEQLLLIPGNIITVFIGKSIPLVFLSFVSASIINMIMILLLKLSLMHFLGILVITIACIPFTLAISLLVAILVIHYKEVFAFLQILMIGFTIILGITFPVNELPAFLRYLSQLFLLPKAIENIRSILLTDATLFTQTILWDTIFIFTIGIVFLFLSFYCLKKAIDKMKAKGTYAYV